MIYRIDFQHFMTHAIDHFDSQELAHFQYAIISAKIRNGHRCDNIEKISELYPTPEIVMNYAEYKDKEIMEKMYMDMLNPKLKDPRDTDYVANMVYRTFVQSLINHYDVVIMCDEIENDYIDVLCKYLKKKFSIEVIDLNELFIKGRVGPIYLDRDKIRDKAVDIRRAAAREQLKALESTREGKLKIIGMMNTKAKISKLKELGIKVSSADKKNLDKLLIEEWAENDNTVDDY